MKEKFEFLVNYDEWLKQSRNSIIRLKDTKDVMVFSPSPMDPTKIVYLDSTRGFTDSRAPELHWQLTIMRRGSLPKIMFLNSLWFVARVSVLAK